MINDMPKSELRSKPQLRKHKHPIEVQMAIEVKTSIEVKSPIKVKFPIEVISPVEVKSSIAEVTCPMTSENPNRGQISNSGSQNFNDMSKCQLRSKTQLRKPHTQ